MTRILVVDDFELLRRGVRSLFQGQSDLEVVDEAADGIEAVSKAEQLQPDVVTLDLNMPRMGGLKAAQLIEKVSPNSRIVFLSQNEVVVPEIFAHEMWSYVSKSDTASELIKAIRTLLKGERFLSSSCSAISVASCDAPNTSESIDTAGRKKAAQSTSKT
jgi:DNA-binding NarL/FixJ family response regulator